MHSGDLGGPVVPAHTSRVMGQSLLSVLYVGKRNAGQLQTKRADILERCAGALGTVKWRTVLRVGCSAATLSGGPGSSRLVLCSSGLLVTGTV